MASCASSNAHQVVLTKFGSGREPSTCPLRFRRSSYTQLAARHLPSRARRKYFHTSLGTFSSALIFARSWACFSFWMMKEEIFGGILADVGSLVGLQLASANARSRKQD